MSILILQTNWMIRMTLEVQKHKMEMLERIKVIIQRRVEDIYVHVHLTPIFSSFEGDK